MLHTSPCELNLLGTLELHRRGSVVTRAWVMTASSAELSLATPTTMLYEDQYREHCWIKYMLERSQHQKLLLLFR